jgi:hypothetical protein
MAEAEGTNTPMESIATDNVAPSDDTRIFFHSFLIFMLRVALIPFSFGIPN